MTKIKDIMSKYQINKTKLSKRFGIPYKTIDNWTSEGNNHRDCPEYVMNMIVEILETSGSDPRERIIYEVSCEDNGFIAPGRCVVLVTFDKAEAIMRAEHPFSKIYMKHGAHNVIRAYKTTTYCQDANKALDELYEQCAEKDGSCPEPFDYIDHENYYYD